MEFASPLFVNVEGRRLAYEGVGHIPEVEAFERFHDDLVSFLT
jgi:hypothetical protein